MIRRQGRRIRCRYFGPRDCYTYSAGTCRPNHDRKSWNSEVIMHVTYMTAPADCHRCGGVTAVAEEAPSVWHAASCQIECELLPASALPAWRMFGPLKRSPSCRRKRTSSAHAVCWEVDVGERCGGNLGLGSQRQTDRGLHAIMRDEGVSSQPWLDLSPRKGRPHAAGCFCATEGGMDR